jgi:hypothetical protein
MTAYDLTSLDLGTIRLALRGDVDMRRYVPEVIALCEKLAIEEPPWFDEEEVRARGAEPCSVDLLPRRSHLPRSVTR